MSRALSCGSIVVLAVLLSGCATQFGTRIPHAAPVAKPHAGVVPAPAPATVAPETFKKRWLHKFFVKRATEK